MINCIVKFKCLVDNKSQLYYVNTYPYGSSLASF